MLIRSASPNRFLQKLDLLSGEALISSMLVSYESGPKKNYQRETAGLNIVVSQSQRRSIYFFELHRNSQIIKVLPLFLPSGMSRGDGVLEPLVFELLRFLMAAIHGCILS